MKKLLLIITFLFLIIPNVTHAEDDIKFSEMTTDDQIYQLLQWINNITTILVEREEVDDDLLERIVVLEEENERILELLESFENSSEDLVIEENGKEFTIEETIQNEINRIVSEDFNKTDINKVDVNLNAGRDDGSYIVLPHLVWNVKNREGMTRDMLKQYSDHLAATLADIDEVSEITVFWEVPYHKENTNIAKYEYNRLAEGMAIGDIWHDIIIRE